MLRYVALLLLVHHISRSSGWMQFPYGNNKFNHEEQYGNNVTISCKDARVPEGHTFEYWIRPDLTIMGKGEMESFWTLDGSATWQVSDDGSTLMATLLNERQFGFYYCVVNAASERHVIKKAINYNGPYFGNRWSTYRMNVIIGLSAAGVFIALVIFLALVATWCKKNDKSHNADKEPASAANGSTARIGNDIQMEKTPNAYEDDAEFHEVRL